MPLMIGGAVLALLAGAMFYVLFSARGRYAEAISGLDNAQGRLNRLTGRATFPSEENVKAMRRQSEAYEEYLRGLFASMRAGQVPDEMVDRDRFRQLLEQTLRRLVQQARAKSIALPADFSFGFQRYAAGALPAETDLERLVSQLRSVAAICDILYEAGIGELVTVERTLFERDLQAAAVVVEEQPVDRRRGRGRGNEPVAPVVDPTALYRDPDGLFTRERYVVSYRAPDATNWKVFDRLAKGAPFVVVTKLEIVNAARPAVAPPRTETPAPGAPGAVPGRPGAAPEVLPRELRVVAGQELPLVRLELDLYRFTEPSAKEGEERS